MSQGKRVRTSNDTAVSLDSWSQTQPSPGWGSTRPVTLLVLYCTPPLLSSECGYSIHRIKSAERSSLGRAWSATFPSVVSCFEPPALPWTSHHQASIRSASNLSLVEASSTRRTHRESPIPLAEIQTDRENACPQPFKCYLRIWKISCSKPSAV